ncbi:MAG: hemerythrin domain-containing protein [Methylotenera sp.]|nr:hemerythrin domain-containing protein [Oligoflexia bacterium]
MAHQKISAGDFLDRNRRRITQFFRLFETVDLRAPELKRAMVNEIFMQLEIHAAIEDSVLYPLLEKYFGRKVAFESLKSMNEGMKRIPELKKINQEDPEFNRIFDGMIQNFELHLREEQAEIALLARAREDFFADLGTWMQIHRDELLSKLKYPIAQPGVAQNPHSGHKRRKSV